MAFRVWVKLLKDRCNMHRIWGDIPFEEGTVKLKRCEGRRETRRRWKLVENKN
jgi:hypothetical protein